MFGIDQTDEFKDWLDALRDHVGRAKILLRLRRIESDEHFGDVEPVGQGVSEVRVHISPGYRLYYIQPETALVVMLCGGDKGSQARDIKRAKKLAQEYRAAR